MAIEHPSMKRTKKTPKPTTGKHYTVENAIPEGMQPMDGMNIPQHIMSGSVQFEEPEPEQEEPAVSIPNRVMLEDLLFLGQASKEVEISNIKFKITTLTNEENNKLMKDLYAFGDGADLFLIRTLTLAHSIKEVNGRSMESIDIDEEFVRPYDKKMAILNKMQKSVIEKLHDEYAKLSEDVDKAILGEDLKNS